MEAWVLILSVGGSLLSGPRTTGIEMQSEDACVIAAKRLTSETGIAIAICVNTFDGRVLYFNRGVQVQRL